MNIVDPIAMGVEIVKIDSGCSLEKEFIELICINPLIVLYLFANQGYLCHDCVCGSLTWDTKDIFWMVDRVLIITYKTLDIGSLKFYTLDMTWSLQKWFCGQDKIVCSSYLRILIKEWTSKTEVHSLWSICLVLLSFFCKKVQQSIWELSIIVIYMKE